ncbi:MAG: hypothetical protein KatS3mg063_2691 [Tepidiforma sp.]|uniref:hypothetical protein n=1 Tax=Tepidiforma sp. TaxID=2682230 RepID=UPI0017FD35D6|nr:hypothetical protein [Tepidiforma sp.]GIW16838.1 MAG: hypothetical protein KatS3mg063_2691 [Tepidiforma sp.]
MRPSSATLLAAEHTLDWVLDTTQALEGRLALLRPALHRAAQALQAAQVAAPPGWRAVCSDAAGLLSQARAECLAARPPTRADLGRAVGALSAAGPALVAAAGALADALGLAAAHLDLIESALSEAVNAARGAALAVSADEARHWLAAASRALTTATDAVPRTERALAQAQTAIQQASAGLARLQARARQDPADPDAADAWW